MNTIKEKILDIINDNDFESAADVIQEIFYELANSPSSVDQENLINKTIDMVCEEQFG